MKNKFYGEGLSYLNLDNCPGSLIVIEGLDGCGRSSQTALLKSYIEEKGYSVLDSGIKRSGIVSKSIDRAKDSTSLTHTTLSLFYATDFADQFESAIIPALRAGHIVLSDRYIYSLMARDLVRGRSKTWLRKLYEFAKIPDIVFYLDIDIEYQIHRYWKRYSQLRYWESGMDMGYSNDMFKSFKIYQMKLRAQMKKLKEEHNFITINANYDENTIHLELSHHIDKFLKNRI